MLRNKIVDFKNPIVLHNLIFNMNVPFEVSVKIVTKIEVLLLLLLFGNEPDSSINLAAFLPISMFIYLFIKNLAIKNKSLNKQALHGAP